jgi:hypothetical protein
VIRKYVFALSALALPLGAVAIGSSTASATVRPHSSVTFTGSVSCALTGAIKAVPAITGTPSTGTIAVSLTGSLTKCTGAITQGGLTISKGIVKSSVTLPAGTSCTTLVSSPPNPTGSITWKPTIVTTTKITPTKFKTSGGSVTSTSPITITYSSSQTGSFAGTGSVKAVVKQTLSTLLTECGTGGTGVSKLNLTTGSTVS